MTDFTLDWDDDPKELAAALNAGVRAGANTLLSESNLRVPIDSGDLEDSGKVSVDGNEAAVSYGTDHAIVVHEKLTLHHLVGEAKFLENALLQESDRILESIADAMRADL